MDELFLVKSDSGAFWPMDNESAAIADKFKPGAEIHCKVQKATRSLKMNACLHKYCQLVADELNGAGLGVMKTLKHDAEISWTGQMVKDLMWRAIQVALTDKESTTEPTNAEYKEVYRHLDRHLSQTKGLPSIAWPNRFGDGW